MHGLSIYYEAIYYEGLPGCLLLMYIEMNPGFRFFFITFYDSDKSCSLSDFTESGMFLGVFAGHVLTVVVFREAPGHYFRFYFCFPEKGKNEVDSNE
jgi:hypothetical protein